MVAGAQGSESGVLECNGSLRCGTAGDGQLSRDKVSNIGRKLLKSSHILAIK